MKARIQWAGEAMFLGESGSGHVVVMDGPPDAGGRNLGVRPMEMLLLGLGTTANIAALSVAESLSPDERRRLTAIGATG